jgi:hypothetical protein
MNLYAYFYRHSQCVSAIYHLNLLLTILIYFYLMNFYLNLNCILNMLNLCLLIYLNIMILLNLFFGHK